MEEKNFHLKVSEPYSDSRDPRKGLFQRIALANPPKPRPVLTEAEILAMQPESTRQKLTGTYKALLEENPDAWKSDKDFLRTITPDEWGIHNAHRHSIGKFTGAYLQNRVDDQKPGEISLEAKAKAAQAFAYSAGVKITMEDAHRLVNMTPIKSEPPIAEEEEPKSRWWHAILRFDEGDAIYVLGVKIW